MNKLIILLLAVCLVSVHAYVKRDAPEAPKGDELFAGLQKQAKETLDAIAEKINPETIKKGFDDAMTNINKVVKSFQPTEVPKA